MWRLVILGALVMGVALGVGLYYVQPASSEPTPQRFAMRAGESAAAIGERLQAQGLIRSSWLFRLVATVSGAEGALEAGEYELRPTMTISEIISRLQRGATLRLTVVEGWRLEQVAAFLEERGLFPKEDFVKAARGQFSYGFLSGRPAGASLEGYLFPDTYFLSPSVTAAELIDRMLANFERRFTPQMRDQAARRGLALHQVVTLASIVEREAMVDEERPLIAAVFLRRLALGMTLDADPTIQYALGSDPALVARFGFWKSPLSRQDVTTNSPYNTYRQRGMPPGPIASPGLASLRAVVEAPETDYLYFVAKGDGSHAFARTLEDHNENIARYRSGALRASGEPQPNPLSKGG